MGTVMKRVGLVLVGLLGLGCDPAEAKEPKPKAPAAVASSEAGVRPVTTWLADGDGSAKERREGAALLKKRRGDRHHAFWSNLREGLDLVDKTTKLPAVSIDDGGRYRFAVE